MLNLQNRLVFRFDNQFVAILLFFFFLNWSNRYSSQLTIWMNKWIECVEGTINKTQHRSFRSVTLDMQTCLWIFEIYHKTECEKGQQKKKQWVKSICRTKNLRQIWTLNANLCFFLLFDVSASKIQNLKIDAMHENLLKFIPLWIWSKVMITHSKLRYAKDYSDWRIRK